MNEKFAIDLIAEEPPKEIHGRHVWCDGGQVFVHIYRPLMVFSPFSNATDCDYINCPCTASDL